MPPIQWPWWPTDPDRDKPDEERGLVEQEMLKRVERMSDADDQRRVIGKYAARHSTPRKRKSWRRLWRRGSE